MFCFNYIISYRRFLPVVSTYTVRLRVMTQWSHRILPNRICNARKSKVEATPENISITFTVKSA